MGYGGRWNERGGSGGLAPSLATQGNNTKPFFIERGVKLVSMNLFQVAVPTPRPTPSWTRLMRRCAEAGVPENPYRPVSLGALLGVIVVTTLFWVWAWEMALG